MTQRLRLDITVLLQLVHVRLEPDLFVAAIKHKKTSPSDDPAHEIALKHESGELTPSPRLRPVPPARRTADHGP
ncbi:MAG: hypothetical protein BJ554DRAFT_2398 [Olpidium bornovanus]|uniref:Uncharacterized protein n=1 Tax=Olpidium bornovanus TaxID=278681 RepID=A0A8H7ZQZ4_9FUNG|nr:MAG: hypothetical protein BJ554DRAFT_2398 [Olpidium bornovanus]